MSRVSERLNRILSMVPFMIGDEGASVEELCHRFDVTRGELVGDLKVLQLCGLPDYTPADLIDYNFEGGRVHLIMADYFDRPLNMTREEALTLFVAGRALMRAGVFDRGTALGTALAKVENVLTDMDKAEVEDVSARIDVEMDPYSGRWKRIIEEGLWKGKDLLIEYYSFSRDEVGRREVEPLSLIWSNGHWYLMAWCHTALEKRLFRLDRIKETELLDRAVTQEVRDSAALPDLVGEYKPDRKSHRVKLVFSGREGSRIQEEWPAAKCTRKRDGTLAVELRTRSLAWLSKYLLRFGDRVRIESPKELAEMVERKARRMLEMYGG